MRWCKQCGKAYTPKSKQQRYCGRACKNMSERGKVYKVYSPTPQEIEKRAQQVRESWEWWGKIDRGNIQH